MEEVTQITPMVGHLSVGDGIASRNASWSFGGDTPRNFEDHVSKSVPFYAEGHEIVLSLSDYFVKENSVCYELGCSTGALTRRLAQRHRPSVQWVGIDVEANMIDQAWQYLNVKTPGVRNVEYVVGDILTYDYQSSDLIVAYYTVQFIPPRVRQELLRRVYESLNWGGAFLLFEKVRGPDARFQDLVSGLYVDYKLDKGYAPEEIIAKSKSLKGVLEPFSTAGNTDMLKRAGFVDIMTIFKHVCFEGFFCIK